MSKIFIKIEKSHPELSQKHAKSQEFFVSAGIKSEDYSEVGRYQLPLNQALYPFELTALYVKADYQPIYAFYGTESNPTSDEVNESAVDYVQKLVSIA